MSEWISVKDNPPKLKDGCFCRIMVNTCQNGDKASRPMIYEGPISSDNKAGRWRYYWGNIVDPEDIPDYWMPLPEPPVKGK